MKNTFLKDCKNSSNRIFIRQNCQFQDDFQKFIGVYSVTKKNRNASTHNSHEKLDKHYWSANEYSIGKRPITETESDHASPCTKWMANQKRVGKVCQDVRKMWVINRKHPSRSWMSVNLMEISNWQVGESEGKKNLRKWTIDTFKEIISHAWHFNQLRIYRQKLT